MVCVCVCDWLTREVCLRGNIQSPKRTLIGVRIFYLQHKNWTFRQRKSGNQDVPVNPPPPHIQLQGSKEAVNMTSILVAVLFFQNKLTEGCWKTFVCSSRSVCYGIWLNFCIYNCSLWCWIYDLCIAFSCILWVVDSFYVCLHVSSTVAFEETIQLML